MSDENTFAIVGTIAGAAVGYYFGGAQGARLGAAVGGMAGRMIDTAVADNDPNGVFEPDSLLGTGITAPTLGKFLPLVFGTYRIPGNIIWSSGRTEFENRSLSGEPAGGKGGFGGPESQTATFSRTYTISVAISLTDHVIERVSRIWADATLLFDDSDQDAVTISGGTVDGDVALTPLDNPPTKVVTHSDSDQVFVLFRGTEDQEPSSFIESFLGIGNVSAYKGVSYMLMQNLNLGSAGRVPNFTFEVVVGLAPNNIPKDIVVSGDNKPIAVFPKSVLDPSTTAPSGTLAIVFNQDTLEPTRQYDVGGGNPLQVEAGDVGGITGIYILKDDHRVGMVTDTGSIIIEGVDYRTSAEILAKTDPGVQSFRAIALVPAVPLKDAVLLTLLTSDEVLLIDFGNAPQTVPQTLVRATVNTGPKDAILNSNNGKFYVSGSTAGTVQKWNVALTTLEDTITVGNNPQALIEDDAGLVWVCNVDDNTVQNFTVDADKSAAITVGTTPTKIVKASDGFLWTLNIGNKTVSRILDISPFTVQNFTTPGTGTAIEPGTNADVWVTDLAGSAVYRIESDGTVTTIRVSRGPQALSVDSDGSVWVANTIARTITKISADATTVLTPENRNGLACVVRTLSELARLEPGEIDVSGLDNTPVNMAITGFGAARIPLENLALIYGFIGVESGGLIKYIFKGGTSVATIPEECLASAQNTPLEESFVITRQQDLEVPTRISIVYLSALRNFQQDTQSMSLNAFVTPLNPLVIHVPMALDAIQARNTAEVLLYESQFARTNYKFALPNKFSLLEPGDIIDVTSRGVAHRMRLTSVVQNPGGDLEFAGTFHRSFLYQDFVGVPGDAPIASGLVGFGDVGIVFVDAPPMDTIDGQDFRYLAAFHPTDVKIFPNTTLFESQDNEASFDSLLSSNSTAIVADVTGTLADGTSHTWDDVTTIDVVLKSSSHQLNTLSDLAVLNGGNIAILGNEVIQFQTATLIATNTYTLSRLLRGRRGTELFTGTHAASEKFVMLEDVLRNRLRVVYDINRVGVQSDFKIVPQTKNIADITSTPFTPQGVSVKPWDPVVQDETQTGDDWNLTWYERARTDNGLVGFTGLSRDPLLTGFRIKIYSDITFTTVVRTEDIGLLVDSDSLHTFVYTSAKQVTDFGSNQSRVFYTIQGLTPGVEGHASQRDTGAVFIVQAAQVIGTTHGSFSGAYNTSDAATGIFSAWIKMLGGDGSTQQIIWTEVSALVRFTVERFSDNKITIFARNSAGSTVMHISSTVTTLPADGWVNVLVSWDTTTGATNLLFIDDTDRTSIVTEDTDSNVDYTGTSNAMLGRTNGSERFNGCLAELYFAPGQYLDFSVVSNRRKFIGSDLKPVNLGPDGATPTGTKPLLYHKGDDTTPNNFITVELGSETSTWLKSGVDVTVCADSPSD